MSTSSTDEGEKEHEPAGTPLTQLYRARRLLRQLGKRPLKGLGQHFLIDTGVLQKIIAAARLTAKDTVVEVGPGLGILTQELARKVSRVIAVELDPILVSFLRDTLADYKNVTIIQANILKTDPAALLGVESRDSSFEPPDPGPQTQGPKVELPPGSSPERQALDPEPGTPVPGPYKVVADLPYNIASPVLRHFLEAACKPELMVVMVQREVAARMAASPGQMSTLSIGIQLYSRPTIVATVSPRSFHPPPKVHSAIVRLEVYPRPAVDVPPDALFRVVRAGFSQPRKQLRNTLAAGLGLKAAEAESILSKVGVDPKRRPQTLSLEEWAALTEAVGRRDTGKTDACPLC